MPSHAMTAAALNAWIEQAETGLGSTVTIEAETARDLARELLALRVRLARIEGPPTPSPGPDREPEGPTEEEPETGGRWEPGRVPYMVEPMEALGRAERMTEWATIALRASLEDGENVVDHEIEARDAWGFARAMEAERLKALRGEGNRV